MICRNRRISTQADEVRLNVSFIVADLRQCLKHYFSLFSIVSPTFAATTPNSEPDLITFFSNTIFNPYSGDILKQLCRWAVATSERDGLIYRGANGDIFLSPELGKKRGRPQEKKQ